LKILMGKWDQSLLLSQNSLTANSFPATTLYSLSNLKYRREEVF